MTLLPNPSLSMPRSARPGLVGAGLAAVALLACHAWLPGNAPLSSAPRAVPLVHPMTAQDDGFADGLLWEWPAQMAGAAGMFQCAPTVGSEVQASVIVWTDSADNVLAFGSAIEGAPWPAYAAAFMPAQAGGPAQPIHMAEQGHAVGASGRDRFVQLRGTRLACVRTWDD
ncbi:hypothetical protein [Pseudorhodoferax soli]|uniref:Uncharacterized protein n=1 Tax=Pseudorhodoferax soli TaxID=545864 RepID=A0A368Y1D2_9BURK|nr:hypothetical protein [Pseudorhodoferax soli]RCW72597.1 hypothetical protein DES41_103203 [Pseudorhodoferax soli]